MSQFSDDMSAVAIELITEFGESVSFERTVQGTYAPSIADTLFDTVSTYTGYAIPSNYTNREIDGTLIQRGDFKVLAHEMSDEPEVGDNLTIGGITCKIVGVTHTKVNGASVLYTLQCRV